MNMPPNTWGVHAGQRPWGIASSGAGSNSNSSSSEQSQQTHPEREAQAISQSVMCEEAPPVTGIS